MVLVHIMCPPSFVFQFIRKVIKFNLFLGACAKRIATNDLEISVVRLSAWDRAILTGPVSVKFIFRTFTITCQVLPIIFEIL